MKSVRCLAVAATVLTVLTTGCTDEPIETSSGFSSMPISGDTAPLTDSSGGSSSEAVPTTQPDPNTGSADNGDVTSDASSSSGGGSFGTTEATTFGSSTSAGPGTNAEDSSGDTGPVIGACGNAMIDPNEQCDGQNLNGFTCESLGNTGGTLLCDGVTCTFDTSLCSNDDSGGTSG